MRTTVHHISSSLQLYSIVLPIDLSIISTKLSTTQGKLSNNSVSLLLHRTRLKTTADCNWYPTEITLNVEQDVEMRMLKRVTVSLKHKNQKAEVKESEDK